MARVLQEYSWFTQLRREMSDNERITDSNTDRVSTVSNKQITYFSIRLFYIITSIHDTPSSCTSTL